MGSTNSLRSYLLGKPRSMFERVVKVGNAVYWRTGDKFYTKGPDGVRREISSSEYDQALANSKRSAEVDLDHWGPNSRNKAQKAHAAMTKRDDIEHRDRQVRLGFSRNGWVSKESMDLAETPASKIKGKKNVKTIKADPGQTVTPESLRGLMGIGKPDAFKSIADALNRGEGIGQADVDGEKILYYGDHVIVR